MNSLLCCICPRSHAGSLVPNVPLMARSNLRRTTRYAPNLQPHTTHILSQGDETLLKTTASSTCSTVWPRRLCEDTGGRGHAARRYSMEELEGFVTEAIRCVPGTAEAIADARERRSNPVRPPAV